jgi:membrane associated rhomboid family serine protease
MRAPSRPPPPSWFSPVTERLSPTITGLVVTLAVSWVVYVTAPALRPFIDNHLALTPSSVAAGEVWQLVTALFIHREAAPVSLFFDALGLWFVGATVERDFGRKKFLLFFFVPALVANAVTTGLALWVKASPLVWGTSSAIMALFVVFARRYNRTPVRVFGALVMEARLLVLLLIGLSVFSQLMAGTWVTLVGELVGLGLAYLISGGRGAGLRALFLRLRSSSARRRLQVVEGGRKPTKEERRSRYLN